MVEYHSKDQGGIFNRFKRINLNWTLVFCQFDPPVDQSEGEREKQKGHVTQMQ